MEQFGRSIARSSVEYAELNQMELVDLYKRSLTTDLSCLVALKLLTIVVENGAKLMLKLTMQDPPRTLR